MQYATAAPNSSRQSKRDAIQSSDIDEWLNKLDIKLRGVEFHRVP